MKLYLIRRGVYYECTQVSPYVFSTRMGHIHPSPYEFHNSITAVFTDQWEALRFQYLYHLTKPPTKRRVFPRLDDSWYRLPYSLTYIKRHLISKWPEDFL